MRKRSLNGVPLLRAILDCDEFFPSIEETAWWDDGEQIENNIGEGCFSGKVKVA